MNLKHLWVSTAGSNQLFTVVRNDHADDIKVCLNVVPLRKVVEDLVVLIQHLEAIYLQQLFLFFNMLSTLNNIMGMRPLSSFILILILKELLFALSLLSFTRKHNIFQLK